MSTKTSVKIAVLSAAVAGGAAIGALVAIPAVSSAQSATPTAASAKATSSPVLRSGRVQAQTGTEDPATTTDPAPSTDPSQEPPAGAQGKAGKGRHGGGGPDGGHVGANGTKEELLTGDDAAKVTAAAQAAVPGGTVERVETDAEGAAFEAHVTKADGSDVTVKLDANFNVTSTEDGHR